MSQSTVLQNEAYKYSTLTRRHTQPRHFISNQNHKQRNSPTKLIALQSWPRHSPWRRCSPWCSSWARPRTSRRASAPPDGRAVRRLLRGAGGGRPAVPLPVQERRRHVGEVLQDRREARHGAAAQVRPRHARQLLMDASRNI